MQPSASVRLAAALAAAALFRAPAAGCAVPPDMAAGLVRPGAGETANGAETAPAFASVLSVPSFSSVFPASAWAGKSEAAAWEKRNADFPPYHVYGRLTRDVGAWPAGTRVELVTAEDTKSFLLRLPDGSRRRVGWEDVTPEAPVPVLRGAVGAGRIEATLAARGAWSRTDRLVWVCLSRLEVYVFAREDECWRLCRRCPCSAGDPAHPTARGRYEVGFRSPCIGKENAYLCRHAVSFFGAYMFHSVLLDPAGETVLDGRLGERISHGCVRLSREDAEALYDTLPIGTAVYVN